MGNIYGPTISSSEIVNIAPGDGQIPLPFTSEANWEALAFLKEHTAGINYFNYPITPSKYGHAILKCCGDRFGSDS